MRNKNVHSGHRTRLRALIDKVGLINLSDVQIIEQILTMTNARKDTNEIAHSLLKRFGSISKILDADYSALIEVEGVGDVTAKMITYLPQIFEIYLKDKTKRLYSCKTIGDVYKYFSNIFKGLTHEVFVISYINKNSTFENYEILAQGDITEVKLSKIEITKSVVYNKAASIITAHNHPFGSAEPSSADYDSFTSLCTFFATLGITYVDNIIIGEDGMFSFKQKSLIEKSLLEK